MFCIENINKIFKEAANDVSCHTGTNIIDINNRNKYLTHYVVDCCTMASSEEEVYMYIYMYLLGIINSRFENMRS